MILFCVQITQYLASGTSFKQSLSPLGMSPSVFDYFLALWPNKIVRLSLYFTYLSPEKKTAISLRSPDPFGEEWHLENKIWEATFVFIATGLSFPLGPQ